MKNLKFYIACAACALTIPVHAQTILPNPVAAAPLVTFSDGQINRMIQVATKDNGKWSMHSPGLSLFDRWAAVQAMSDKTGETSAGFSVTIYTAPSWIEYQATLALHLMEPFTPASVTPDMRQDVVRVIAYPSTATALTGAGLADTSNVSHVVMQDATRKVVIQPTSETVVDQTQDSALRSATTHGISAVFAQADVLRIRGADGKGEFFVTVIGDNARRAHKDFKVKSKDFDQLIGQ